MMSELSMEEKARLYDEQKKKRAEDARKGGSAPKHFTPETKEKQREGARKGGQHSHMHDAYNNK
jgi:general stress protein YciG